MLKPRTAIAVTAILVTGLVLYWSLGGHNPLLRSADKLGLNRQMDYFVNTVQLTQWQEDGELIRTSESLRIEHYPQQALAKLATPISHFYRQDGSVIRVTAEQGSVPDDNSRIELAGNVVVLDNPDTLLGTRLDTEQLTIYPEKKQADSNVRVIITHPDSRSEGIGMQADLEQGILELQSQVKGIIHNAQ